MRGEVCINIPITAGVLGVLEDRNGRGGEMERENAGNNSWNWGTFPCRGMEA